jgi:hypothetical protein
MRLTDLEIEMVRIHKRKRVGRPQTPNRRRFKLDKKQEE